jgi:hypothetical protein
LLLDHDEESLIKFFHAENGGQAAPLALREWIGRMQGYARAGYAFDLEENEDQVRCVAAPIRDVAGRIVAAISVASAAQYMSDARMRLLTKDVVGTAQRISEGLGWAEKPTPAAAAAAAQPTAAPAKATSSRATPSKAVPAASPRPSSRKSQVSLQTPAPRKTRARHLGNRKSRSR